MKIAVKVETRILCNWRNIEPLQPEGFKGQTENEKETLKNSIIKNGFNNAFDVWQHNGKLLSIDGVHRKIALLELAAEGYEIPEQLPCTNVHGVTPIIPTKEGGYRNSLIFYPLKAFLNTK